MPSLYGCHCLDERPAGEVAIDYELEDVVVAAGLREVPVVVIGFVEEVKLVHPLDPPDLDLHIEVFGVEVGAVALDRIGELVGADGVAVGDDRPVVRLGVDARDLVGRELEDLELDPGPFEGGGGCRENQGGHGGKKDRSLVHQMTPQRRPVVVGGASRSIGCPDTLRQGGHGKPCPYISR